MASPWPPQPAQPQIASTSTSPFPTHLPDMSANLNPLPPNLGSSMANSPNLNFAQILLAQHNPNAHSTSLFGSSPLASSSVTPLLPNTGQIPQSPWNFQQPHMIGGVTPNLTMNLGGTPFPPPSHVGTGTGLGGKNDVDLEEVLGAIDGAKMVLERLKALLKERKRLEGLVFAAKSSKDGVDSDVDRGGLVAVQTEYVQLLQALTSLSVVNLFGALPLDPTSISHNGSNEANMTTGDLIAWAESRAALEFSRREAVKNASKTVLEVLKMGKT